MRFVIQQVFSCVETGLFWKKMPSRTTIKEEQEAFLDHKPMKDRLSLMLCGNASGCLKIKPLLVYHCENPQFFWKNNVQKSTLPVM